MAYTKNVAFNERQDPLVRQLALKVLQSLLELEWANEVCATSLRNKIHSLAPSSYSVHFVDGNQVEMVYDAHTTVGDVIEQVAHTIGLKNWKCFAIHESKGDYDVMLDNSLLVADALSTEYCIERDDKKLLMKLVILDSQEADMSDPQMVHLSYTQSQVSYRQAPSPMTEADAIYLCALQFCVQHGTEQIEEASLATLARAAHNYIPKKVITAPKHHSWLSAVGVQAGSRGKRRSLLDGGPDCFTAKNKTRCV